VLWKTRSPVGLPITNHQGEEHDLLAGAILPIEGAFEVGAGHSNDPGPSPLTLDSPMTGPSGGVVEEQPSDERVDDHHDVVVQVLVDRVELLRDDKVHSVNLASGFAHFGLSPTIGKSGQM